MTRHTHSPISARHRHAVPLALAALATGALAITMTQAAGATTSPAGTTPAASGAGNLESNSSFETTTAPWGGNRLSRVAKPNGADGRYAARVIAQSGKLTLSDWPGAVHSTTAGSTYTASLALATGSVSSIGAPVNLVVREHDASGSWVASAESTRPLARSYATLTATVTAKRSGDYVDVYAYQGNVVVGSSFLADTAVLTAQNPTPAPSTSPTAPSSSVAPTAPPSSAPPSSPASSPPSSSSASSLGLLAIDSGQADHLGDTSRYAYVVLQESQYAHVAAIKAANPNTKVLTYMEAAATQSQSCSGSTPVMHLPRDSYGVNYCWALQNHPDWFLTDSAGNRLSAVDYPRSMTMDVGNAGYATAWAQGSYAAARADGFDGVYLDDVNVDPGHGLEGRIKQYTDQQYGSATVQFVNTVGDYLRSHGMTAIANVGMSPWVSWMLSDTLAMAPHLSAVNREHFSRYGDVCGSFGERFNTTATNGTPPMDIMLRYEQQLQAAGTHITGLDYGYTNDTASDVATMAYGRAQFLLAWDGAPGSAYFFRRCSAVDTAAPRWMTDLGLPTGAVTTTADGALVRTYSNGVVVLNPNRSTKVSVTLRGQPAPIQIDPQAAVLLPS